MLEAKEGCAFLEDTDERTFLLFSQYAYTGDYTTADPEVPDASAITTAPTVNEVLPYPVKGGIVQTHSAAYVYPGPDSIPEEVPYLEMADDSFGLGFSSKSEKKKGKTKAELSKKLKLWDSFKSKTYTASKPPLLHGKNLLESYKTHTEGFLDHAQVYVFAEKYDIDPLRCLSLEKLHQALVRHNLRDEPVEKIFDLIQYTYSNTMDLSETTDGLRLLVISYAACVVEDLAQNAKFHSLLEQSGPAAKDLIIQMLKRLD